MREIGTVWVYPGTHVPLHTLTLLKGGPNLRGLSHGGVCTKQCGRSRDKEGAPVLSDRRKAAPWASGKSCDLTELQGLSPKAV